MKDVSQFRRFRGGVMLILLVMAVQLSIDLPAEDDAAFSGSVHIIRGGGPPSYPMDLWAEFSSSTGSYSHAPDQMGWFCKNLTNKTLRINWVIFNWDTMIEEKGEQLLGPGGMLGNPWWRYTKEHTSFAWSPYVGDPKDYKGSQQDGGNCCSEYQSTRGASQAQVVGEPGVNPNSADPVRYADGEMQMWEGSSGIPVGLIHL